VSSRRREKRKRPQRVSAKRRLQRYDPDSKRRERRKQRQRVSARQRCQEYDPAEATPGTPSDLIKHFATEVEKGNVSEVMVHYRVSGRWPNWQVRLDRGIENLRRVAEQYGVEVVGECREVGSGWKREKRAKFIAKNAEAKSRSVPILDATTCRLVRNEGYPEVDWPMVADLDHLARLADGVTLLTVLPPDTLPKTCNRYLQDCGRKLSGNKPGPKKAKPKVSKPRIIGGEQRKLIDAIIRLWPSLPNDRGERV